MPARGPEQNLNYGFGLGGTLIKDKSSFNLNVFGINAYDTPNLNAALPTGTRAARADVKSPRDNLFVNGQLDYALTLDQTLRFGYNLSRFTNDNLGVGGYDEPERAYSTDNSVAQRPRPALRTARPPRVPALAGAVVLVRTPTAESATEAPTIRVLDAFTSGGAQRRRRRSLAARSTSASDLDYVRGRHSLRAGIVARRRLVSLGRLVELSRHLHVRQPRRVSREPAEQLHAADRRSDLSLSERAGRRLRAGRHPRPRRT